MASAASLDPELVLADEMALCYGDPVRFVLLAFPWGEQGPLKDYAGPDGWQREFLEGIGAEVRRNGFDGLHAVPAIRRAVSSGHGIGKSTLAAWLVCWIMSTRPHAQGTITANTYTQLETKTWAAVKRWMALCITSHWFVSGDQRMYHKDHKDTWFCSPQSSKEENSEAFAGQHAVGSTSFYIFDEDSGISDGVHEVAEGGLTDGEPMIFLFGNCTRITGNFYRSCFGAQRDRWAPIVVDSRNSSFTNKDQIAEWIELYGEDSDFVRVRVRGLAPRASDAQFIDQERVLQAQRRQVVVLEDEPLVAGVDLAWGGEDDNVIRFRRGADARTIPPIRIKGEFTRDPAVMVNRLADIMTKDYHGRTIHTLFLDSAGIAGPIGARLRQLGFRNVQEVNFGADSPDVKCRFMRDYIWQEMKQWLITAAIDKDPQLEADLCGPGVLNDLKQRVWLESKKDMKARGLDSPDDGDALALTFASKVAPPRKRKDGAAQMPKNWAWS
jgi:hypothetical protein